jgi:hypothetical protein
MWIIFFAKILHMGNGDRVTSASLGHIGFVDLAAIDIESKAATRAN